MTYPDNIFAGMVANRAAELPDFDVLTIEGAGVRPDEVRSYRQLWDNGRRMAQVMLDLGIAPGERIALLMANHAEFVEAMVAAAVVGAAVVPIDPRTRGDKLHFLLASSQCAAAFAADYALPHLQPLRARLPGLRWAMAFATDEGDRPLSAWDGVADWEALAPAAAPDLPIRTTDPDAALELIFTSGTTGDPKGIVMTHRRYCETALLAQSLFGYREDDVLYSGLSLTHANAQLITLGAALACRLRCVLSRRFSKSRLWDITRKYGATTFTLLGGMTTAVYAEPPKANDADNSVRFVVSAGMPAAIWKDFQRRFGVQILEFYGAAEGGLTFNYPGQGPVGSIGKPPPTLKHRIVDESGNDVPRGAQGELLFRHASGDPFVVQYFGSPEASQRKCAGGWLHMGDVVHEDAEGWLYFDYRKGSGIRRNGEFVATAFIEKAIAESGLVDDVYVYGIASPRLAPGEKEVVAAVVPKDAVAFDARQLFAVCLQQLEAGMVPDCIQVLAQIPKTASEKPQDRFLQEAFEREPQAVHCARPDRAAGRAGAV
ncbi:MAG TPA: AMP-binding protein [Alicycliphilus sp.]|nr:AMP-binding protein [Alicycliphilus sp.]